MSFRVTAIALAVLVVLGGIVWFSEFREKEQSAAAKSGESANLEVLKFQESDARQLQVSRSGATTQVQRDEQGNWTILPSGQPGDRLRISSIIARLSTLQGTRRVADEATDLVQYGLDNPAVTATVTLADGSAHSLLTGAKSPAGAGTYAKSGSGSAVFLISNQIVSDLERFVTEPPVQPPTPTPAPTAEGAPPSPSPAPTPAG